jgi:hypothetical protein
MYPDKAVANNPALRNITTSLFILGTTIRYLKKSIEVKKKRM